MWGHSTGWGQRGDTVHPWVRSPHLGARWRVPSLLGTSLLCSASFFPGVPPRCAAPSGTTGTWVALRVSPGRECPGATTTDYHVHGHCSQCALSTGAPSRVTAAQSCPSPLGTRPPPAAAFLPNPLHRVLRRCQVKAASSGVSWSCPADLQWVGERGNPVSPCPLPATQGCCGAAPHHPHPQPEGKKSGEAEKM